jgi:hypothetical protein
MRGNTFKKNNEKRQKFAWEIAPRGGPLPAHSRSIGSLQHAFLCFFFELHLHRAAPPGLQTNLFFFLRPFFFELIGLINITRGSPARRKFPRLFCA